MEIRSNGGDDFKALAKRFRTAGNDGKQLRRGLTQMFQREMKPIVDNVQNAVRTLKVKGARGGGRKVRGRVDLAAELRRTAKAQARGRKARARRGVAVSTGLRARIAHGVKSRVQWSGIRYGVRVWVDTSSLPASQRRLPKHLDSPKGWRHPVFGDRDWWVTQYGGPWFGITIKRYEAKLRRFVTQQVNDTLRKMR